MAGRRSPIETMLDILVIIDQAPGILPTHVMYQSNLSWTVMKKMQQVLIEAECLEKADSFVITEKGRGLAQQWRKTCEALDGGVRKYYSLMHPSVTDA
jgi:predicted transcriptional regulator